MNIKDFECETNLKVIKYLGHYTERSGKSNNYVINEINKFNKKYNTNVAAYIDPIKDIVILYNLNLILEEI